MILRKCFIAISLAFTSGSTFAQADIAIPIDAAPKGTPVREVVLPANMVRPTKTLKSELDYSLEDESSGESSDEAVSRPAAAAATAQASPTARVVSQTPGVAGTSATAYIPPSSPADFIQRAVNPMQSTITVRPGVTEMIPVPVHYLTRIATPFAQPQVKTVNEVEVDVVGSTLFVSPSTDAPIGVFVFDLADPTSAVTLQLLPQDIPQRDITLNVQGYAAGLPNARSQGSGDSGETFTSTIVHTFADLARGRIPRGYTLTAPRPNEFRCDVAGLSIRLGQVAESTRFRIGVFLVENTSFKPVNFDEKWCYEPRVAGVSTWPATLLNPGERTELFVMYHVEQEREQASERPSLLGNR